MPLLQATQSVRLKLAKDRLRAIKQGAPWVYADWLVETPSAPPGSRALLRDREGQILAAGMYDPSSPLTMRVCAVEREILDESFVLERLAGALKLREVLFDEDTTGYRVVNGEGDGLPGLVMDRYGDHAVIKFDGAGPAGFWDAQGIASWLATAVPVKRVYLKFRAGDDERGKVVFGDPPPPAVPFREHGIAFEADIVAGQKTGFFFDQRDNRARIGVLARGRSTLNMCGYTGGFSVYAGRGGATQVTTVDLAKPAIAAAERNWQLNDLAPTAHEGVVADAFDYFAAAKEAARRWELIIVDPPSFAHAERMVEKAAASYVSLFTAAFRVAAPGAFVALSSCSSHISHTHFMEICQSALSAARRRGTVHGVYGQPEDHPFPSACPELQYLKFFIFSVR